jgi:Zn-dependent protease with chaperone function
VPSARNIYRLNLLLAGLGGLAVMLGMAIALRGIDFTSTPAERLVSYCQRFLLPHMTAGSALTLALGVLGAVVIALAVRSALRQLAGCWRFLRALEVVSEREFDQTRVRMIAGSEPQAFCAGLVRPRIYLSCAAVDLLTRPELDAVIAHESHHARRRDPLRIVLVSVLADALFFLPALRRLQRRYGELAEIAADQAAVAAVGDPSPLAAALLRFAERGTPGVVGIAPERVDHLLGEPPRWELSRSLITGTVVTVLGLLAVILTAAHATGNARISLTLLAAQSCMITMTALPIITLVALAALGRRAVGTRNP